MTTGEELYEELGKINKMTPQQTRVVVEGKEIYPNKRTLPMYKNNKLVVQIRSRALGGMYK